MKRHSQANIKKNKVIRLFVTVAAISVVISGLAFYFIGKNSEGLVIAKVNNQKIYRSEVERKIAAVFSSNDNRIEVPALESLPTEIIETFVKEIYLEKELVLRAKKSKILKQEEVQNALKDAEAKIITNSYIDSILQDKITDEKISEKYAELSNEMAGKKEFLISHIVVKNKEEANKIYKELTDKKSKKQPKFSDLAKKYSVDKDSSSKGGSLGYLLEDNIIKEIVDVLPSLKKSEISKPVQTKFGWHIIKIDDIKETKPLAFESVKENIKEQIIRSETSEIYNDVFKDVKIKILIENKAQENIKPINATDEAKKPIEVKAESSK